MGYSTIKNVRFCGVASCIPRRSISNLEDCPAAFRDERSRLVRNIGINNRPICADEQCFSDLALEAAEKLLVQLKWDKSEIDALIVVTQSPDYPIPATAIILQHRLGLGTGTVAFDINLGCSGYPFGLNILASMISAGTVKKGLLLVGDKSDNIHNPLFADAGTATALEFSENASPLYFDLNSDGSGFRAIIKPVGGHREPYGPKHIMAVRKANGMISKPDDLILDGTAVLSFSTQKVPPQITALLKYAGLEKTAIDYFVFHQANKIINETIVKKIGVEPAKAPTTLSDFGNTSSASIPLTITHKLGSTLASGTHKLFLSGFGVGLSWGACIVDMENCAFPALIEA
jgi:3-oxoacyl-[acyl-carrier-protein] synthase-3